MTERAGITDEQARALWQRAAELQAAAEHGRDRVLPAETLPAAGLSLEQIAQAAEGAGIDPDYVRVAVAEQQLSDGDRIDRNLWSARWLRALLREPDAIELSRVIRASPAAVLAALRSVAERPAFQLMLETMVGSDPTRDGVLVYRLSGNRTGFGQGMDFSDARVLLFTIRAEQDATRLRVRVPLYRRGVNLGITGGVSGVLAWVGMSAGAAVGGLLPAAVAGSAAVVAAPVVVGGVAGIVAGVGLYRGLYRYVYRGGQAGVVQLVHVVALEAESADGPGSAFHPRVLT